MMTIDKYNFAGKKAIVRVDFNVPLKDGKITDDTRIRGALPTLKLILEKGGALIIMSHMGKPKGKVKPELSLGQIVDAVSAALGTPVKFVNDCMKADAEAAALKPGEVLLLENLRFYPEEEGKPVGLDKGTPEYDEAKKALKATQKEFAKKLASYADCWVMDAFGTAHRKHASTAVIADYFDADNKMLGLLMEKEVKAVDNVLNNIQRPFIAIMGGSKVSSKIGIIENLLGKVDKLILLDIYPAREEPIPGVTSETIFGKVTAPQKVQLKKEELMDYLSHEEIDILITFGAGNIDRFVPEITRMLESR